MYSTTWTRPQQIEFPKVWSTFERKTPSSESLQFEIRDMTEVHYEEAFSIMEKYFLTQETFHTTAGFTNPSAHATFIRGLVERIMLPQRLSLVCVVKFNDHQNNNILKTKYQNEIKVVGYNFLGVAKRNEEIDVTEWENHDTGRKFLKILQEIKKRCPNLMEKYDANEYIGSLGLCIHPDYRGMKIAEEMLKARFILCKAVNVKLTYSTFTASASQKIALKCGFVEEYSTEYSEAEKWLDFKFITKQTSCKVLSYLIK